MIEGDYLPLTRREFLLTTAAAPLLAATKTVTAPPNILLIVADGLSAWMCGCYGNREIKTPHIDRLAQGGVRFINNFACTPSSSPSRATLLTGRTPMQHGIQSSITATPIEQPPQGQFDVPASFHQEVMISDLLSQQGYDAGYFGKWNLGDDRTPQHNFQSWYGMLAETRSYERPRMSANGQTIEETGYLAELVTRHVSTFLDDRQPTRPFFAVASYLNPHPPYEGHPAKYYEMYANTKFDSVGWDSASPAALREKEYLSDIVGNLRKAAAAITALDDQVGALFMKLGQRGLRDNTIVIFTSSEGSLLGRHGLWGDGRGSEPINMYDEVVQVPMIWNWPGRIPVESSRPELVSLYDVMPTICEATGVALPSARNLCGRSYLPILTNTPLPKKNPWRNLVFGHFRDTEMVRDTRYKLVLRNNGAGPNEFYDLKADSREKVNQYEKPEFITVRERMTAELNSWRKQYS